MSRSSQIERIVLSFILSLAFSVFVFMSLQITYYEHYIPVESFFKSEVEFAKNEMVINSNEILIQESGGEVKNLSRNISDPREKSNNNYNQNSNSGDPYQTIKDFENQLFEESGGNKEREKYLKDKQQNQNSENQKKTDQGKGDKQDGSGQQYNGNVMVEWKLDGRSAHENNNWWVRNPGYTCGYGSSGKVVIRISVDQGGRVVQANYDASASTGANDCMVQQALKYAKLSRFNYKESSVSQQGFIVYKFISQ